MIGSEHGGMCAMKEIPLSSEGDKERSARVKENVSFYIRCICKEDSSVPTCLFVSCQYGSSHNSHFSYRRLRY